MNTPISSADPSYNLMMFACQGDQGEQDVDAIISNYINQGANVNFKDDEGNTPLHKAAQNAHKKVIVSLFEHGAKLQFNNLHYTPEGVTEDHEIQELIANKSEEMNFRAIQNTFSGKCNIFFSKVLIKTMLVAEIVFFRRISVKSYNAKTDANRKCFIEKIKFAQKFVNSLSVGLIFGAAALTKNIEFPYSEGSISKWKLWSFQIFKFVAICSSIAAVLYFRNNIKIHLSNRNLSEIGEEIEPLSDVETNFKATKFLLGLGAQPYLNCLEYDESKWEQLAEEECKIEQLYVQYEQKLRQRKYNSITLFDINPDEMLESVEDDNNDKQSLGETLKIVDKLKENKA